MYRAENPYRKLRTRASLNGYSMALSMSDHALHRTHQRIQGDANDILQRIALLIENPEVAEYVTLDVKIGDTCVIYDADTGSTYVLAVQETEIVVKTVYAPERASDIFFVSEEDSFGVLVKKAKVLFGGIPQDFQRAVENLSMGLGMPATR